MQMTHTPNTWSWIPISWLVLYPIVTILGYVASIVLRQEPFAMILLAGLPIVVAVTTYRNLVGGGCTLRFQVCALVKGIIAGVIFVLLSFVADVVVWEAIGVAVGLNLVAYGQLGIVSYYAWFLGALVGGFAARVSEVRGGSRPVGQVTVSGFE